VLVGGGLQNGLIALALLNGRPRARVALLERGDVVGGNHLWSFHAGDVPDDARSLVEPLVAHRWPGYQVAFPGRDRALDEPYAAIPSSRLDCVVRERFATAPGCDLMTGADVVSVGPHQVTLADGRRIEGRLVIDARGPGALPSTRAAGYQKFLGLELRVDPAACPGRPTLMDATVPQRDGLRFVYVLPLGPDRVLVEDTYFSDTPDLDAGALRPGILAYARARGLAPADVLREETGVLPLPWRLDPPPARPGVLVAGYQGGWFHPATGYSLPLAVRLATVVARHGAGELLASDDLRRLVAERDRQLGFLLLLNELMFNAYSGDRRVDVMARFYRLPVPLIRRFYAMRVTLADRLRILAGRPPRGLSLRRALRHWLQPPDGA
jgi:lycopene beta-cyclase